MTKAQLIEIVRRRLPVRIHDQVIAKYLELAYGQMLDALFLSDESTIDQYTFMCYDIPVSFLAGKGSYSDIPVKIAGLSSPGSGVRNIYTSGMSAKFAPVTRSSMSVLDGLEVMSLDPVIPYITQGNTVSYIDMPKEISIVNMAVVRSISGMDDDEEIVLPSSSDEQFLEVVLNLLMGQPASKKSNDNTSNPL